MSIQRIFHCDWRECQSHGGPSMGFLTVEDGEGYTLHFCSWDCVLHYAAEIPPVQIVAATNE